MEIKAATTEASARPKPVGSKSSNASTVRRRKNRTIPLIAVTMELGAALPDGEEPTHHPAVDELEQRLRLIADALRAKDPIGLADILLHEMPTVVQSWRTMLGELQDNLQGREQEP